MQAATGIRKVQLSMAPAAVLPRAIFGNMQRSLDTGIQPVVRLTCLKSVISSDQVSISDKRLLVTYLGLDEELIKGINSDQFILLLKGTVSDKTLQRLADPLKTDALKETDLRAIARGERKGIDLDAAHDVLSVLALALPDQSNLQTLSLMAFNALFPSEKGRLTDLPLLGIGQAPAAVPAPQVPVAAAAPVARSVTETEIMSPVTDITEELGKMAAQIGRISTLFSTIRDSTEDHSKKLKLIKGVINSDPELSKTDDEIDQYSDKLHNLNEEIGHNSDVIDENAKIAQEALIKGTDRRAELKAVEWKASFSIFPDSIKADIQTIEQEASELSSAIVKILDIWFEVLPKITGSWGREKAMKGILESTPNLLQNMPDARQKYEILMSRNKEVNKITASAQGVMKDITDQIEKFRLLATFVDVGAVQSAPGSAAQPVAVSQPEPPTLQVAAPLPAPAPALPPSPPPRRMPPLPTQRQRPAAPAQAAAPQAAPAVAAPPVAPLSGPAALMIRPLQGDFRGFKQYLEMLAAVDLRAALPLIVEWLKAHKELGDKFDKLEDEMKKVGDNELKEKAVTAIEVTLFDLGEKGNEFAKAAFLAMNENAVI